MSGERIALGNTKSKLIEGYATVSVVKKMSVVEMKKNNTKHFANDFINKRWKNRKWLYAFVLSEISEVAPNQKKHYPSSHGNPKVHLE